MKKCSEPYLSKKPAYVFITGGVLSSVGKGLLAAVLGRILKEHGLRVVLRKFDPYLNINPGLMSPAEHGEVYVTRDGNETDLDLGHYERFAGVTTCASDYITAGQVYQDVLKQERSGFLAGKTAQVVPHVTDRFREFLLHKAGKADVVIVEMGGTVGDIEGVPFLETVRQLRSLKQLVTCCVHVGWVPILGVTREFKTKPLQHSIKALQHTGIHPDVLVVRSEKRLNNETFQKIGTLCGMPASYVIRAEDQADLYALPEAYHKEGLDRAVLGVLGSGILKQPLSLVAIKKWRQLSSFKQKQRLLVGIVGKYVRFADAYKSLEEALKHAQFSEKTQIKILWIDPQVIKDKQDFINMSLDGVVVPGGFGERGVEDTLRTIRFAYAENTPFLGICLGMQLALIALMQEEEGFDKAHSLEFVETDKALFIPMEEKRSQKKQTGFVGCMRLGAHKVVLYENTKLSVFFEGPVLYERHRHRFAFNMMFKEAVMRAGVTLSGFSECGRVLEIFEKPDRHFFVGVQFHPEFESFPERPHPLFSAFIRHTLLYKRSSSA